MRGERGTIGGHRRLRQAGLVLLAGVLFAGGAARARAAGGNGDAGKGGYTLFNPTPWALMREMETDRPDVTESPRTVDAGHVQVELSLLAYTHEREGEAHADTLAILPANLKVGLTNDVDLQLVLDPYTHGRGRAADGTSRRSSGFGDTQLRLKINLWGNDGGPTALGVMPFVQFPTAGDERGTGCVEGGVIVPFSADLPAGFGMAAMAELDLVRDEANEGYGVEFLHTVNLNRDLFGDLGGYVEYVGVSPIDTGGGYVALLSLGLTYGLSDDVQLDAGVNIGLSDAAEDYTVFAGVSFRL